MTRYELLKQNERINYKYVKNGILSYQIIRDIEIYESFNSLKENIGKEMKYVMISEQYDLSTDRIKQILYNMQTVIK
jgi:myo-inositol-1-phosphate synthase